MKLPRCLVWVLSVFGLLTTVSAADFFEEFQHAPSGINWLVHGDSSLFRWNPDGHLEVTWDSTRTNSFFIHPLHSVLGRDDAFTFEFDLTLQSIEAGVNNGATGSFELAVGLINQADATDTNFFRGKGTGTVRNLVEFDYFPDTGLGETIWPAIWSTNAALNYNDQNDYTLKALPMDQVLHISLDYDPADRTLTTVITADGEPFGPALSTTLSPSFTDFRVDAFAICSYSSAGSPAWLLADGMIDNIRLTFPRPVTDLALRQDQGGWTARFLSGTNWTYQLEEAATLNDWSAVGASVEGTGSTIELPVSHSTTSVFTRVRATRK